MFSRFARSGFLGLSQANSRALSTLRLSQPRRLAVPPSYSNLRQFSAAPESREKLTRDRPNPGKPEFEPSGTCFIANIPYEVTAEQLKEAFSEFGTVEAFRLMTSSTGVSRGTGFVQFRSVEDAVNFVEASLADPIYVLDRQLFVNHARNPSNPATEPSDTLVVHGIQGESDAEVRSMFGNFADRILDVRYHQKEGNALDKVFVQFRNVHVAMDAMEAFKEQNTSGQVGYARHRQTRRDLYSLTSGLSQQRNQ